MSFQFVQGRTNNHLTWCFVDATDFATRESALSAAAKIKIYGTLEGATGINFVSSGTGSLTNDIQHVGASAAGVYHIALAKADLSDASAAWYDEYVVILSATGAAFETFIIEGVRTDTSYLSNILSNLSSISSDIYSALALTNSRVLLNLSRISDMASYLVLMSGLDSDVQSAVALANSRVLLIQSRLSDLDSRLVSDLSDILSGIVALSDATSNAYSAAVVGASRILLVQSRLSDFDSRLVSDVSDIRSAIAAITVTVTASDISDIASAVWAHTIGARVDSRLLLTQSFASDAASAAVQGNSRILLVQSRLSDFDSRVASDLSDMLSGLVALSDAVSNAYSAAVVGASRILLVQSRLSDFDSRMVSDVSDIRSAIAAITATVSASDISDIASAVWANTIGARVDSRLLLNQSRISDIASYLVVMSGIQSDIYSAVSDLNSDLRSLITTTGVQLNASSLSDLRSAITAATATVSASDISDIASAVWANTIGARVDSRVLLVQSRLSDFDSRVASDLSDIYSGIVALSDATSNAYSAAVVGASRILLVQSRLSDFDSRMVSDVSDIRSAIAAITVAISASDVSDIASAVLAGLTGLTASDISDIASAVWAHTVGARVDSRVLVNQSRVSDIASYLVVMSGIQSDLYSLLSDVYSDFQSRVPKLVATNSQLSDLHSDIRSYLVGMSGMLSDTHSAATQGSSRALLVQSQVSDIYSLLSDIGSDVGVMSGVQSDMYSMLSDFASDFSSRIPAVFTELASTPDAAPSLRQALMLPYMWLRNPTEGTPTKRKVKNAAGATVTSATVSWNAGTSVFEQGTLG